jgi:hypothetical protein
MNKLISFLILAICGGIAFFYLSQETAPVNNEVSRQKEQVSDTPTASPTELPEKAIAIKPKTKIKPPPAPGQKPIINQVAPEPEIIEDDPTKSYPIEDAEIYFVPPEDRYPGNLGGPPPLNLPDQDFPNE